MNSIVILCGGVASGKTSTMRGFFGVSKISNFIDRKINGKIVCAVRDSSIQERLGKEGFCNVKKVQEDIDNQIEKCNEETKGEPYILIIPFTMRTSNNDRKKLNENCILKPIQQLKKRFNVFVLYLRKKNTQLLSEKDDLMKRMTTDVIETTKDDYDKSKELEKYLRKKVIKSI